MKTPKEILQKLDACDEAIEWAGNKSIEEIVNTCHRGDWLLWLANKIEIDVQPLTLAKGLCANTVRHLMRDERSIKAVDTAIAFGEGRESGDELDSAAAYYYDYYAASASAAALAAASAAASALAAASAASAACAYASSAAASAAYAASASSAALAASAAAYAADAASVKKQNQMLTADICRKYIGDLIIEKFKQQEQ